MSARIEILVADRRWDKQAGLSHRLRRSAVLALEQGGCRRKDASVTILLASDARLKQLNARFRGKDKATNVLSFPAVAGDDAHLGDIALAYGIAAKEARAGRKPLVDHATHLAVHGVLHLLGFDHNTSRAAKKMEPLETLILARLGISDPYAQRPNAA